MTTTSGIERLEPVNPVWYGGVLKNLLTPKPPWPVGGESWVPSHQDSLKYEDPGPVVFGESAGTATVFGAPSRQVLPVSPEPLKMLIPPAWAV